MPKSTKILYCILNWGLGHASRSIPIINTLLSKSVELVIASDGRAGQFIQKEFPNLKYISLPGYNINYGGNMILNMSLQVPKIANAIKKEHAFLDQLCQTTSFDFIISDNRYGCYHKTIPSIFITHQLRIKAPLQLGEYIVEKINKRLIENFKTCWIPDFEGAENLSGVLSHGSKMKRIKFIGPLSRMSKMKPSNPKVEFDAIAVLSGPEPLRTNLEEKLLSQMKKLRDKSFLIVRGIPSEKNELEKRDNISLKNYLLSKELNEALMASKIVICRSGYSSLMDLASLSKKAILIPTKGQTEQEYLARKLESEQIFYSCPEDKFDLALALERSRDYTGFNWNAIENELLENAINQLLVC